jgi:hypothetical protein
MLIRAIITLANFATQFLVHKQACQKRWHLLVQCKLVAAKRKPGKYPRTTLIWGPAIYRNLFEQMTGRMLD